MSPCITTSLAALAGIILGIAGIQCMKRNELRESWEEVRLAAEKKGLVLHLVSDRTYCRGRRPLPRGGILYRMGSDLYVRYAHVSQGEALAFIGK